MSFENGCVNKKYQIYKKFGVIEFPESILYTFVNDCYVPCKFVSSYDKYMALFKHNMYCCIDGRYIPTNIINSFPKKYLHNNCHIKRHNLPDT